MTSQSIKTNETNRTENPFAKSEERFCYMLLGRLQMDCHYFLGNGNRLEKHLWGLNVPDHIQTMRDLWDRVTEKPEWISLEEIEDFEARMTGSTSCESV